MKIFTFWLVTIAFAFSAATDDFINQAKAKHGAFGEKAARFLVEHMPANDKKKLTAEFLNENLELALKARAIFPWAKDVPEEIFFNDVLPYAVFDEPRDPWRAEFLERATPLIRDAKTASEAAQILNRDFFKLINTHYNTGRKRTNQSPKESIEQGKATCTGLSIILVDVCRAVGIPARAVGTPLWFDKSGNHTWVEIWDDGWHFTGADEYDKNGLNHGWFVKNASKADASKPIHSIYASSWKKDGGHFPMVWSQKNTEVGGVNVTKRYATQSAPIATTMGIRFFDGDQRIEMKGTLTTADRKPISSFQTKAGTTDLNDMPRMIIEPGKTYRLQFEIDSKIFETKPLRPGHDRNVYDIRKSDLKPVAIAAENDKPITKQNADQSIQLAYKNLLAAQKKKRAAELKAKSITIGDHTMKWLEKTFGEEPKTGRSLWISMHGGGGAPARVNEQQWKNQIKLYQPAEGIYLAPRAPTNTWNLWHQNHIDPLFARLIENMIALRGVDPNKIYLMGYSAGGDGVWQLAPRMADRFAAAAMMAGHPNESSLLGLRNLPFAIFMGANDSAHNRNKVATEKTAAIKALNEADPKGYTHISRIYEGLGHWMKLKDAEALPWMEKFTRNPWPKKIVWFQDDVTHDRFYWLQLPDGAAAKDQKIIATVDGQNIQLKGEIPKGTRLLLSDHLLNLDQPVTVKINGAPPKKFTPKRSMEVIREAMAEQLDPASAPTAAITLP
ncbi:MAG: transglutaminase domain-containing protein [Akkermansiaceae bacterium]